MIDTVNVDPIAIETRARALRAAYMRELFHGFLSRVRGTAVRIAHA